MKTLASLLLAALLCACGGGSAPADNAPSDPPVSRAEGIDRFLLFPNPQVQPDGTLQTEYARLREAYYAAIDPTTRKDTLAKWKAANGFDTGTGTRSRSSSATRATWATAGA